MIYWHLFEPPPKWCILLHSSVINKCLCDIADAKSIRMNAVPDRWYRVCHRRPCTSRIHWAWCPLHSNNYTDIGDAPVDEQVVRFLGLFLLAQLLLDPLLDQGFDLPVLECLEGQEPRIKAGSTCCFAGRAESICGAFRLSPWSCPGRTPGNFWPAAHATRTSTAPCMVWSLWPKVNIYYTLALGIP